MAFIAFLMGQSQWKIFRNNFLFHPKMYCLVLLVIMLCTVAVDSAIVKRSYSDQSVRGYLTEVLNLCNKRRVCFVIPFPY